MPSGGTYKTRGVVLRKTKLGEKDLIVTLIDESGSLVRAVAKGARKPGGSFAARIELFSLVDCLFARGKSLDVISEARFAKGHESRTLDLEQAACASAIAELVCNVSQEGLEQPRLYEMTAAAIDAIAASEPADALAITAADLLKVLASAGFRPSFDVCVSCGLPIELGDADAGQWMSVSFEDGGVVCPSCARLANGVPIEASTLAWARALLYTRFSDVPALEVDAGVSLSVLQFARQWARVHTGRDLKSADFLFTAGLF